MTDEMMALWVPQQPAEPPPPPMTFNERMLAGDLRRAEAKAQKYEMALRMILVVSQLEAHELAREALRDVPTVSQ